jgi:AcrR family transcriptional regulator
MSRPADPHARIDLLRAAEAVFVERGLDVARVEEITARAGRSKGSFYLHFSSKEEAFRQIVETLLARLQSCMEEDGGAPWERGEPMAPEALSAEWLAKDCEVFEFLWQNRRLVRLLFQGGKSAQYHHLVDAFAEHSRERLRQFLLWGKAQGHFDSGIDEDLASIAIAGAYDRVARAVVKAERKPDLSRMCGVLQTFVMQGIARRAVDGIVDQPAMNEAPRKKARGG